MLSVSLLGIALASHWKFDDTARVFPRYFFVNLMMCFPKHIFKNKTGQDYPTEEPPLGKLFTCSHFLVTTPPLVGKVYSVEE